MAAIEIEESWQIALAAEFERPYFKQLISFLKAEKARGKVIFPAGGNIFAAFKHTPFHKVRVVILGQDPYHGAGQAQGLCFSVPHGIAVPPSLQNIYKELQADVGFQVPNHGCLHAWADQGVLLLNTTLTVEEGMPLSHSHAGWENFTEAVLSHLAAHTKHLVFMLWGSWAHRKASNILGSNHLILKCAHPSPLSAYRGFFGCKHFSKANDYLVSNGKGLINWQLS